MERDPANAGVRDGDATSVRAGEQLRRRQHEKAFDRLLHLSAEFHDLNPEGKPAQRIS